MFKSVFAKYTLVFVLIILLCLSVILAIVTSVIGQYSEEAKAEIMETVARSSTTYLEGLLSDENIDDIGKLVSQKSERISEMLSAVSSETDDIFVMISDHEGRLVLSAGSDRTDIRSDLPLAENLISALQRGETMSFNGNLDGILSETLSVHVSPIYGNDGEVAGGLVVCSGREIIPQLLTTVIKAIAMAVMWVLLATMIAIYFISEKMVTPIREISRAAKSFAQGKFDVRVPVRGRDEIAELAIAMNNMAESLDNYDTMRNTFMSNVSHDLRSPMTSISGFIDGILDGVIPPEEHEYYLNIVSSEIKRLSRLVSSLLDLSRIQAGERKFTKAPFDICEVARQIIISFEQKIEDKALEVEFDIDDEKMIAVADRDAIYQVLYNLCDNGVKFSDEGGHFRLSIRKLKGRKLLVSVYNEGKGISDDDLSYVFDRFYKSDKSRGLNKNGVGLGLYISKTIIEAHGENIWVDSEYGKNCCFSFTLAGE